MIGAYLGDISARHFALQAAYPILVGTIGNRHQLGIGIASSHSGEPDAQILLEPQVLEFDGYRRKADRLHCRHDGLGRPEIRKIDREGLREIVVIEPIWMLLWTKIAHAARRIDW